MRPSRKKRARAQRRSADRTRAQGLWKPRFALEGGNRKETYSRGRFVALVLTLEGIAGKKLSGPSRKCLKAWVESQPRPNVAIRKLPRALLSLSPIKSGGKSFAHSCHSERSEESLLAMELDSFVATLLRMTNKGPGYIISTLPG